MRYLLLILLLASCQPINSVEKEPKPETSLETIQAENYDLDFPYYWIDTDLIEPPEPCYWDEECHGGLTSGDPTIK